MDLLFCVKNRDCNSQSSIAFLLRDDHITRMHLYTYIDEKMSYCRTNTVALTRRRAYWAGPPVFFCRSWASSETCSVNYKYYHRHMKIIEPGWHCLLFKKPRFRRWRHNGAIGLIYRQHSPADWQSRLIEWKYWRLTLYFCQISTPGLSSLSGLAIKARVSTKVQAKCV